MAPEKKNKNREKYAKVQKIILGALLVAGVVSLAVFAPNAVQTLKMFDGGRRRKKDPRYVVSNSINRLKEKGYISFENTRKGTFVRLTDKGDSRLRLIEAHDFNIKKPARWDGKWRIIIFDIKEKRKSLRDKIRLTLTSIGFIRLQDSVWVYPYPCEDLIVLLKADFMVGKDVLYITADNIENDRGLRGHFRL